MARIKFSPLITSIKGKLGSSVFQGGKSGIILRQKSIGVTGRTAKQQAVRQNMTNVKLEWRDLSTAERNSWIAFASFYRKPTKHNITKFLTPYELFVQSNMIRLQSGVSVLKSTTLALFAPAIIDMSIEVVGGNQLLIQGGTEPELPDQHIAISLSRGVNVSTHIADSAVRFVLFAFLPMPVTDITNEYLSLFGELPKNGQKIKTKVIAFADESGWNSKPNIDETIL